MHKLRIYPKRLLWRLYIIGLVLSLGFDFYWLYRQAFHYHFAFQQIPQFFALFGVFGCMLLILIAKAMGIFIVVDEDYYQKKEGPKH